MVNADADLEVEGVGRFYDRITLENYSHGDKRQNDDRSRLPKGILRNNQSHHNQSSFNSSYYHGRGGYDN